VSKNTHAVRRPSAWATRGSASYTELLKRLRTIPTYSVYGKIARLLRASQELGLFLMTQAQSRWACFARTEHHQYLSSRPFPPVSEKRRGHPLSGTKKKWGAAFACQEKRRPELRRAFLLPMRSLVKCIPDRPMHAGGIVMALRCVASRDIKNLHGPEPLVRPSLPRVGDRSAWPRNRLPKSPRR